MRSLDIEPGAKHDVVKSSLSLKKDLFYFRLILEWRKIACESNVFGSIIFYSISFSELLTRTCNAISMTATKPHVEAMKTS